MSEEFPITDNPGRISSERIRFGFLLSAFGLLTMTVAAKPEWFNLNQSASVGFLQIAVFLIGLAITCVGGFIELAALWGQNERSILADIGIRLISTGFVVALFAGMADILGMTFQQAIKQPFFGHWQEAGMEVGMGIIMIGLLMLIPYKYLTNPKLYL